MTKTENNICLFSITLCWAASYIFIKDLPPGFSSYAYLTMTTGIAAILLSVIFMKKLHRADGKTILRSLILAGLLTVDLLTEKKGLETLSSSNASFISSLNILFVPMILLLFHQKPTKNNVVGMIIILTGLMITNKFNIHGFVNMGTFYVVAGCLVMALYTIFSADFTKKSDPLTLSVLQIIFTAIIGFGLWFLEDPRTFASLTYSKRMLSSIFILAFFSKGYAYVMLMYSEKYATAFRVTVIASTEPVVTLALALMIPNAMGQTEQFHVRALVGAVCIAIGAVVAGTDFLSRSRQNERAGS